jgi:hypothetical protein
LLYYILIALGLLDGQPDGHMDPQDACHSPDRVKIPVDLPPTFFNFSSQPKSTRHRMAVLGEIPTDPWLLLFH